MQEKAESAKCDGSSTAACTLDSLAVYLTLQKARELHGFNQEEFGLTDDEANDIARVFSLYDSNDDYRLDLAEFETLCRDAGRSLTRPEAQAALNTIDVNGNGFIEFNEFVKFWKQPQGKSGTMTTEPVA